MKKTFVFVMAGLLSLPGMALTKIKDKAVIEKAASSLKPLKKNLMKTLKGEMKAGGPVKALSACNTEAPKIKEKINKDLKAKGITIGRTSHKVRNAKNAPKEWVKSFLGDYVRGKRTGKVAVDLGDKIGYLEPIKIAKPVCLKCHGGDIAAPITKALNEKYPHDKATGFKLNEFRGLFWVEMNK